MKNKLLSQSIVEDGKHGKNDYVGKIMPCLFFQVSQKKFEFHTNPYIRKTAQKYAFSDATVSISLKILYSNLNKLTRFFQIVTTIFNNILGFIHCFCTAFDGVFHVFRSTNKTFEQNKKYTLDKTGEGNVVLDLTISA